MDCAVRAMLEPLGVLTRVRVIGRALERYVECHFHSVLTRSLEQAVEVIECAEARIDGLVPALFGADRPRAAGLAGAGGRPGCYPLSKCLCLGMGGRQF